MAQADVESSTGRQGYAVISLQWALDLVVPLVGFSVGILLPQMTRDLGMTPVQAGLLGSSFFLGSLSVAMLSSVVFSRYSPRKVTAVATFLGVLFVALQGLAPTYMVLIVSRFMFIISLVSRVQAEVILIRQWFPRERIAVINSIAAGAGSAGQAIAVFVTPFLLLALGTWRNIYLSLSAVFLAIGVAWLVVGRERPGPPVAARSARGESPLRVLRRHKRLFILGFAPAGGALAFSAYMTFWPTFATEAHGLSLTTVGTLMALYPFAGIAANLSAGPVSDLVRRRKPFIWIPGLILPPCYVALLALEAIPALAAIMVLTGVCAWIWVSIIRTIPFDMGLEPREIAVATGLTMTLLPLGGGSGPLIAGTVLELTGSLHTALLSVSFFPLTLLLGLLLPETSPFRRGLAPNPQQARP